MTEAAMKILFVAHYGGRGGAPLSLRLLASELQARGHEVRVATPPGPLRFDLEASGLRCIPIPLVGFLISTCGAELTGIRFIASLARYFCGWIARRALRSAIREFVPDVVHCNEFGMFSVAVLAKKMGRPVVMHARTCISTRPGWYRLWAKHRVARDVDCVIAIDESVGKSLAGIADPVTAYNPMPMADRRPPRRPIDGLTRVCFLSGLLPLKGVWDLLEAARILRHRNDIKFDIYGENSRSPAFMRTISGQLLQVAGILDDTEAKARSFINRLGMVNVTLHGMTTDTVGALAQSDILAFPSHLDGPGRSVFEAGCLGVPSIVAMRNKIQDIVNDGVNGIIVSERCPEELAAAIAMLADSPVLRERLGRSAQEQFTTQFSSVHCADAVEKVYMRLVSR